MDNYIHVLHLLIKRRIPHFTPSLPRPRTFDLLYFPFPIAYFLLPNTCSLFSLATENKLIMLGSQDDF